MEEQIKEIKNFFEKLKELDSDEDKNALLEKMGELEKHWKKFGDKLSEEIDLWEEELNKEREIAIEREKEKETAYELKKERIKNFRKIAEEFKN